MTIVNRRTFTVLHGKSQEAIDLLRREAQDSRYRYRIYSSLYGRFDEVVLEVEFESTAQMEAAWAEWGAQPTVQEFSVRWDAATEAHGRNEVWVLEGQG